MVKWKDYSEKESTWELKNNLKNATEIEKYNKNFIDDLNKKQKTKTLHRNITLRNKTQALCSFVIEDPKSFQDVFGRKDEDDWIKEIQSESKSLLDNTT